MLVTGASGVGKSTVRTLVEPELGPEVECVELSHVLPLRASPDLVWRHQAVEAAVHRAVELQSLGRHLLLAGDPVPVAEVVAAPSAPHLEELAVYLLDASPEAQSDRLNSRGDDPAVLHHHHAFADWMREAATNPLHMPEVVATNGWDAMRWERLERMVGGWHVSILDTSTKDRTEVGAAVLAWCKDALSGKAETMRLRKTLR